jgi:5-methylcytosine-specific restriction enzyme subunit McrC
MGALFEEFVRNFLRSEQDHFLVKREHIKWAAEPINSGAEVFLPVMKTDISLVAPGRKIVIDTKFYQSPLGLTRQGGSRKLHAAHLYQVYAYLKNLEAHGIRRADAAVLLYASSGERFDLRYRVGLHEIQARTLNLDQPWQGIRSDLVMFAKELQHAQPTDVAR